MRVFHDTRQKSRPVGRDWCRGSGTTRILPNEPSRALVSDFTSRKKPKCDVNTIFINFYFNMNLHKPCQNLMIFMYFCLFLSKKSLLCANFGHFFQKTELNFLKLSNFFWKLSKFFRNWAKFFPKLTNTKFLGVLTI